MEKVETPLDVLSRAATMVQPCPAYPASDSEGFETPSTVSSGGESEGDRALSPDAPLAQAKELTGKWRRERRPVRLPEYRPRESGKSSLRSQSFRENRGIAGMHARAPHSDGDLSDETEDRPANLSVNTKEFPTSPDLGEPKELTGKWRRERRSVRLPDYIPRESDKMALRSQSFKEHRSIGSVHARAMPHSDGELSDETEDGPANLSVNAKVAPPEYNSSVKNEAPIDMRLRTRPAPPPYTRPSVITRGADKPTGSLSMCDPVIDEHFRRSLGDDYMKLYKKSQETAQPTPKPNMKDRASSPIEFNMAEPATKQSKIIAMEVDDANMSVDDHFAKALGETWKQIQTSRLKPNDSDKREQSCSEEVVDDHFSKALGDTWKKIRKSPDDKKKDQSTKIISRSGVVI